MIPTYSEIGNKCALLIRRVMEDGEQSHGKNVWFNNESSQRQVLLAARHLLTYQLQASGEKPADGDDHLVNALVRVAMAIAKRDECGTLCE